MRFFNLTTSVRNPFAPSLLFLVLACGNGLAQISATTEKGSLTGNVVDPQGALIPQTIVSATDRNGTATSATADELGRYIIDNLAPGLYVVEAEATGFRTFHKEGVTIVAGPAQRLNLTLAIEVQQQQVEVSDSDLDPSPEKNGGAITLKGKELDALSDDQATMQAQLEAIAGSDPEAGSQFYVDGFSGGKLPPKSAIREIRINQNPYSAQYDQLGFGRIEIFTKPGGNKLHGDVWMEGNDSPFNARNPFVTTQPAYYMYQSEGDVNGPITKAMSYFASGYGQRAINDSIVNAAILDSSLNQTTFQQAISSPTSILNLSPRIDLQAGKNQTLSLRYELQRMTETNSGVGQFNLDSQAINVENTEQVLQFSDTQTYGAKVVNETRFQYIRDRNNQVAQNMSPTIAVQGAFTGGGNAQGVTRDKQDHYEFQDYIQIAAGKHDLNIGARLRDVRDSNYSTAGFNGQFTFASLNAYQITQQGIRDGLSPAAIRASGGGASLFNQTQGLPGIAVSLFDAGLYAEDNWKIRPDVTFSYGLRFESQTQIHDHADYGPRLGVAWSIPGGKNKPPKAVIRAGGGWFYQRFMSTNVLQAQRQNGITQSAVVVNLPDFYPTTCSSNASVCAGASAGSPTIYKISPTLRAPYIAMMGVGADVPVGKYVSISANYMYSRGEHLFLTRNINAPLPGTYDPTDPASGTRPLGTNENVYEYNSEGTSQRNRLVVNGNLHMKKAGIFGYYMLGKMDTNTSGVSDFPSNQYDLHVDYGRATQDLRSRMFLGGFVQLPLKISLSPFLIYQSSAPFNIVVGQDLNGDTQFNDRPAFATDLSRASVYRTKWGTFDAMPIAGQKIIPINYGTGPSLALLNLRLSKSFSFGPIVPDEVPPDANDKDAKDKEAKDKDARKDSKTDAKPVEKTDSKSNNKAPAKPVKKEIQRRYELGFGVNSNNIFNHVNLAPPIGVLGSPLFGQSTSLANLFGSASANRTVNLDLFFRF